ncbi:MAG: hypothetical protein J6Z31_08705 [Fibrobacter sp.]|nr:hypothetical protein [Fibrobacter sp.]
MNFKIALGFCCAFMSFFTACGGTSDGSNLELPDNLPPACREIDFVEQPDMRELCGVRTVHFKSYRNIPKERYLISPKDAKLVLIEDRVELRIPGNFPVELSGSIVKELQFDQNARLNKIRNQYEYYEGYKGASRKREDRIRAFKLSIPTEAGTKYEYCFRIPEKFGNARTRNQAMGNRLEELNCSEFDSISK